MTTHPNRNLAPAERAARQQRQISYRGYLLTWDAIRDYWWISKDGANIAGGHRTVTAAQADVDLLI